LQGLRPGLLEDAADVLQGVVLPQVGELDVGEREGVVRDGGQVRGQRRRLADGLGEGGGTEDKAKSQGEHVSHGKSSLTGRASRGTGRETCPTGRLTGCPGSPSRRPSG